MSGTAIMYAATPPHLNAVRLRPLPRYFHQRERAVVFRSICPPPAHPVAPFITSPIVLCHVP
eukprot:3615405-Rhodomonas_salina.1